MGSSFDSRSNASAVGGSVETFGAAFDFPREPRPEPDGARGVLPPLGGRAVARRPVMERNARHSVTSDDDSSAA